MAIERRESMSTSASIHFTRKGAAMKVVSRVLVVVAALGDLNMTTTAATTSLRRASVISLDRRPCTIACDNGIR